jgi:hypothetical protein
MKERGRTNPFSITGVLCWADHVFAYIALLMSGSSHPVCGAGKDNVSVNESCSRIRCVVTTDSF